MMKSIFKKYLSIVLSAQLLVTSTAVAASEAPVKQKMAHSLIHAMKKEMDQNGKFYYPERYVQYEELTAGNEIQVRNQEVLDRLVDDSFSLREIKDQMISQLNEQERIQVTEMEFVLSRMSSETMENIFNSAVKNSYYPKYFNEKFEGAYSLLEKRDVMLEMVSRDLSQLKSTAIKRIGLATRENLISEIELTNTFFVYKANGKWKKIAVIALSIAAAGFITWGIVSSIKDKYARKTKRMHEEYDGKETDLEHDFATKEANLIAEHETRARLREEGYVWQVCNTEVKSTSTSCLFDHSSHSGNETCITRCLKDPITGAEELHQKSCTSAYIPVNCHIQNEFDRGNDNGYDDGYYDGYDYAYQSAYNSAYNQYYSSAYNSGYSHGYGYGYDDGYDRGYEDSVAEEEYDDTYYDDEDVWYVPMAKSLNPADDFTKNFKKGYQEGYSLGRLMLLGSF